MPDINVHLAINRIQARNRTITGVKTAPDLEGYLAAVQVGQLPYVITWPGDGQWGIKGHGWKTDHRTMLVIVFVEPLGQGSIPTRAVQAIDLFDRVRDYYLTAANISLAEPNTDGYQITVESSPNVSHSDNGLQSDLAIGGQTYHSFILRLKTRILWT